MRLVISELTNSPIAFPAMEFKTRKEINEEVFFT
jgi:hypothetical protein